jgi:hypothetical protein
MDPLHTEESAKADRQLNERLDEIESAQEAPDSVSVKFQERVDEYQQESLDRSDAEEACLSAINADMMVIARLNGKKLSSAMKAGTVNIIDSPELGGVISVQTGLVRQITHVTAIVTRLEQLREKARGQRNSHHFGSGPRPVTRRTAR